MKHQITLTIALFLCCSLVGSAQTATTSQKKSQPQKRWVKITDTIFGDKEVETVVEINEANITRKDQDIIEYWVRFTPLKPKSLQKYNYTLFHQRADCANLMIGIISATKYQKGQKPISEKPEKVQMNPVIPDSNMDMVFQKACSLK